MQKITYRYDRRKAKKFQDSSVQAPQHLVHILKRAIDEKGSFVLTAEGHSMFPTIKPNEQVIVEKLERAPAIGEIVLISTTRGLCIHRVRWVQGGEVVTMGDGNRLIDERCQLTDILGIVNYKLVDGRPELIEEVQLPRFVSYVAPPNTSVTIIDPRIDPSGIERLRIQEICGKLGFETRFCSAQSELYALLGDDEYRIGICQQAPVSEDEIFRIIQTYAGNRKLHFIIGGSYGYPGNELGLLPHNVAHILARIGPFGLMNEEVPALVVLGYLAGLLQG